MLLLTVPLWAQQPLKSIDRGTPVVHGRDLPPANLTVRPEIQQFVELATSGARRGQYTDPSRWVSPHLPHGRGYTVTTDPTTGTVIRIAGRPRQLRGGTSGEGDEMAYLLAVAAELELAQPGEELRLENVHPDAEGRYHARVRQYYRGLEVVPAEATIHASRGREYDLFTGRLRSTPTGLDVVPTLSAEESMQTVRRTFDHWVDVPAAQQQFLSGPQLTAELVVYAPEGSEPELAYRVEARPHLGDHQTVYVDAKTGAEIHRFGHVCRMVDDLPPSTATRPDLYGNNLTIQTHREDDGSYILADITRPMFDESGEIPKGMILTYDAQGGSPQNEEFSPEIGRSADNTDWSPVAVSVHNNAALAYEYFRTRLTRNSIDNLGSNVLSLYDVTNEDGTDMDNAFWNGVAMFYGNGKDFLSGVAKATDVAGHEMSHGIIQHTANLEYQNESGALNESFADVFGYLLENEVGDFRLGEDIVSPVYFPTGAMRDMSDPNNGGKTANNFGYQPGHMSEFEHVGPDDDNGGVHANSGIPNRAFYYFVTAAGIGEAKAEKVYYRAISEYLTRSSRFVDARIAVVQSAMDLYGAEAATAAGSAFDKVGIGGGQGGDYQDDLETNDGNRFLLVSDEDLTAYYRTTEGGELLDNPLAVIGQTSRASISDDGAFALFIDEDNDLRLLDLVNKTVAYIEEDPSGLWRNIALSKDGQRFAVTTRELDNRIYVGDLTTGNFDIFELTNPTTAGGVSTNNVDYSDALEWDYGGEYLMYDAQSHLEETTFWDIGFLRAWNAADDEFGDGQIIKLYSNLDPGVSVGNPTFAKNSPYIIAFERFEESAGTYDLIAANIETGESSLVWGNLRLNYPNYGVGDDRLVFDAELDDGTAVLAVVGMDGDKISPAGDPEVLLQGARWGQFYANGERDTNTGIGGPVLEDPLVRVYPSVSADRVPFTVERPVGMAGTVTVYDMAGHRLADQPISGVRSSVELTGLPAGSYLLAIPVEGGYVMRRVLRAG